MGSDRTDAHLSPDVLVDLAENVIVDARWKEHLSRCESCATKVLELRQTLQTAAKVLCPEPGEDYFRDFGRRLHFEARAAEAKRRRSWGAAAAAVAVVTFGLWLGGAVIDRTVSVPAPTEMSLLPPADQDRELQFLIEVGEWTELADDREFGFELVSSSAFDVSELTTEELIKFREQLEQDLKAEDHAQS